MSATTYAFGSEITIRNLLTAYQGEMNTLAKYRIYATQADQEGWFGVGSLFRAAARAEQIHANAQARAIRHLGGTATAVVELPRLHNTMENLRDALDGENYEIAVVYPAFLEEAATCINAVAARSFRWALEAEKTHVRLYSEALRLLESSQFKTWISAAHDFYVCPVCACTSKENESGGNCAVCNYPTDRTELVR